MRVALRTRRRVDEHDAYGYPTGRWSWGPWEVLERMDADKAEERLKFWRELNDYAVSQRGPQNTKRQHDTVPEETWLDPALYPKPR